GDSAQGVGVLVVHDPVQWIPANQAWLGRGDVLAARKRPVLKPSDSEPVRELVEEVVQGPVFDPCEQQPEEDEPAVDVAVATDCVERFGQNGFGDVARLARVQIEPGGWYQARGVREDLPGGHHAPVPGRTG